MKNFTATYTPIPNCAPGATVVCEAAIAAATAADAGTFNIVFVVYGPNGYSKESSILYGKALTTAPQTFSQSIALPASVTAGPFAAQITVRDPTTWAWQNVSPRSTAFTVALVGSVAATLIKISGDDQGGTISTTQPAPMVVKALDASSLPVPGATVNFATTAGTLSAASATTGADGTASVTLTHGATPQTETVTASLGSISTTFTQTSHMVLYGKFSHPTLTLLKPAGVGDVLGGVGFLPDTGDTWVRIDAASDEFTGNTIDLTKWRTRLPGGYDHYNDELERYVDSGITVSNGTCKLTAHARPYDPAAPGHAPSPSGFQYPLFDSGCISSHTLLAFGYFEARMKFPKGQGVWPAYWLLPNTNYQGEIDIVEYVYNNGTEHQNMIHNNNLDNWPGSTVFWSDANYNAQYGYWMAPAPLSPTYMVDDWHTVGCYWNELDHTTTIYIDGYPVSQRRIGPDAQLSAIILNMAMGGAWPTTNASGVKWSQPVDLTDQVFEISHVRVSQKAGKILTSQV